MKISEETSCESSSSPPTVCNLFDLFTSASGSLQHPLPTSHHIPREAFPYYSHPPGQIPLYSHLGPLYFSFMGLITVAKLISVRLIPPLNEEVINYVSGDKGYSRNTT